MLLAANQNSMVLVPRSWSKTPSLCSGRSHPESAMLGARAHQAPVENGGVIWNGSKTQGDLGAATKIMDVK